MTPLIKGIVASGITGHLNTTPVDNGAMEPIAMITVGSAGTGTIEFTSIPSTYTHLQLRGIYTCGSGGTLRFRVGSGGSIDVGSNYAGSQFSANGSSVSQWNFSPNNDSAYLLLESEQAYQWSFVTDILEYKNTNKTKSMRSIIGGQNNGSGFIGNMNMMWNSKNTITNIRINTQTSAFTEGSTFALYGIKGTL